MSHWLSGIPFCEGGEEVNGAGTDIRTVSGRLGHKDADITLNVYSHVLEAQDRGAFEYLGKLVELPRLTNTVEQRES